MERESLSSFVTVYGNGFILNGFTVNGQGVRYQQEIPR